MSSFSTFFFFNDTATTEIYTLSLHDALPICVHETGEESRRVPVRIEHIVIDDDDRVHGRGGDRKSTRLNSSHGYISYAVFCLKKKKQTHTETSCTDDARRPDMSR